MAAGVARGARAVVAGMVAGDRSACTSARHPACLRMRTHPARTRACMGHARTITDDDAAHALARWAAACASALARGMPACLTTPHSDSLQMEPCVRAGGRPPRPARVPSSHRLLSGPLTQQLSGLERVVRGGSRRKTHAVGAVSRVAVGDDEGLGQLMVGKAPRGLEALLRGRRTGFQLAKESLISGSTCRRRADQRISERRRASATHYCKVELIKAANSSSTGVRASGPTLAPVYRSADSACMYVYMCAPLAYHPVPRPR